MIWLILVGWPVIFLAGYWYGWARCSKLVRSIAEEQS